MQEVLFRHANILPLGEIDSEYDKSVPVCMELRTGAGPADALYLTPTGRIVLAEFKLWRNPQARRAVIGQILDYARVVASWTYDDLDREVRSRTRKSPFEIVSEADGTVQEHVFIDNVARRLKRGEFLLLIVGDRIREDSEKIVSFVQEHSGLRFNLALIEAAVFRRRDGEELIIQPRVPARTELIHRTVLVRRTILEETDDDPIEEHGPSPIEEHQPSPIAAENERFWRAVLGDDFAFDDPEPTVPQPSRSATVWVKVEGSGHGGWGISFGAYLYRSGPTIGTYVTCRDGFPKEKRVFEEIHDALDSDEELAVALNGWRLWSSRAGRPHLGFTRKSEFVDGTAIRDFEDAVAWMRDHFNRLVTALHPECRRRLRAKG